MTRTMTTTTAAAAVLLAVAATSSPASAAEPRVLTDPTPLRLVEPRAATARSDGERFVVITFARDMGRPVEVHDTFTGRRVRLAPDCTPAASVDATGWLKAGRGLFLCDTAPAYRLVDLGNGATFLGLPTSLEAGGQRFENPDYTLLGRRWIMAYGTCSEQTTCASIYYDYRTGETRVSPYPDGPEHRSRRLFYDLDDPDLPLRRVCRPSIRYDGSTHHYRPPWYVERYSGLRRCADGKLVLGFGRDDDATSDLTAAAVSWGTVFPDETKRTAYASVYQLRQKRLLKWRLPQIRRHPAGTAITTRCEVYTLTSRTYGDRGGGPSSIRIDQAKLPRPRDRRCRG